MHLASVEIERVVEGTVGALLLAVVLATGGLILLRRWRAGRDARRPEPGVPALARFADTETLDILAFGGGAGAARVARRHDIVTYGYLAVAEEFVATRTGHRWCTLTVSLPGRVPFLVADHRRALGAVGVPLESPYRVTVDDPSFDDAYLLGAGEPDSAARVLVPAARAVLLDRPVQRLMLHDSALLLRSFDGVRLDEATMAGLSRSAALFLASTPSFVRSTLATSAPASAEAPLPEGLYGPAEQ